MQVSDTIKFLSVFILAIIATAVAGWLTGSSRKLVCRILAEDLHMHNFLAVMASGPMAIGAVAVVISYAAAWVCFARAAGW